LFITLDFLWNLNAWYIWNNRCSWLRNWCFDLGFSCLSFSYFCWIIICFLLCHDVSNRSVIRNLFSFGSSKVLKVEILYQTVHLLQLWKISKMFRIFILNYTIFCSKSKTSINWISFCNSCKWTRYFIFDEFILFFLFHWQLVIQLFIFLIEFTNSLLRISFLIF
jgi:hypothetical protein